MTKNIPKTHLIVEEKRVRCGKVIVWNTEYTDQIKDVTCKSCKEAYAYENGKVREYRLGGKFDATGKERKFSGWSGYKEEWFKEKERADKLEKEKKELVTALTECLYFTVMRDPQVNTHKQACDSIEDITRAALSEAKEL